MTFSRDMMPNSLATPRPDHVTVSVSPSPDTQPKARQSPAASAIESRSAST
jgi:hypothetical protein